MWSESWSASAPTSERMSHLVGRLAARIQEAVRLIEAAMEEQGGSRPGNGTAPVSQEGPRGV